MAALPWAPSARRGGQDHRCQGNLTHDDIANGLGAAAAGATFPRSLPTAMVVGALAQGSFAHVGFTIAFMFLLFHTGTLPSRRGAWSPAACRSTNSSPGTQMPDDCSQVKDRRLKTLVVAGLRCHPGKCGKRLCCTSGCCLLESELRAPRPGRGVRDGDFA
jgi:hypothetical protein